MKKCRLPPKRLAMSRPNPSSTSRRTRAASQSMRSSWSFSHLKISMGLSRQRRGSARSYQARLLLTMRTSHSITGTSISTPTTVASAAPESKP
ncbi:hypothetical protein D3C78_1763920 [compost metagenome]